MVRRWDWEEELPSLSIQWEGEEHLAFLFHVAVHGMRRESEELTPDTRLFVSVLFLFVGPHWTSLDLLFVCCFLLLIFRTGKPKASDSSTAG